MSADAFQEFQDLGVIPRSRDEQQPAWRLSATPNYDSAMPLETVHASDMREREFWELYVCQNRPCLVKQAASHWKATELWKNPAYLKNNAPSAPVKVRSGPLCEHAVVLPQKLRAEVNRYHDLIWESVPFHEFVDRANSGGGQYVLHSISLAKNTPLGRLGEDVGDFAFLPRLPKPRLYPPIRAFFYRDSYSDWHYHPNDETLLTQIVGAKEVLLLPPDQATWDALLPVATSVGFVFEIDTDRFPEAASLRPIKVSMEAGDSLYIPAYWWHAVASTDDGFGISVAQTFRTPLHLSGNLKFPAVRYRAKLVLASPWAPIMAWNLASTMVFNIVRGGDQVSHCRGKSRRQ